MLCPYCKQTNRETARYCKRCGKALNLSEAFLESQSVRSPCAPQQTTPVPTTGLSILVDKEEIRTLLTDVTEKAKSMTERYRSLGIKRRMELSFVITGEVGTGKTTVAKALAEELFPAGILTKKEPLTVIPINYDGFVKDLVKNAAQAAGGMLVVDEAEKLVPEGEAVEEARIDYMLAAVKEWRGEVGKPVVVFTGLPRLKHFFSLNPNAASAINYFVETSEISVNGLVEITRRELEEVYKHSVVPDTLEKLRRIYINDRRHPDEAKGAHGHNAHRRAYEIELSYTNRHLTVEPVTPDCVEGKEFVPKTFEEVMKEFDRYVGVEEIKESIRSIANSLEQARRLKGPEAQIVIKDHFQFLGNPGTGKTTMARLFADALNALGALPMGQLVEVSRKDLVSQYMGETPKTVTRQVDRAMGGVLFIDEAYSLKSSDNDSIGQEAIDTLLQLAENRRGQLVIILAGYTKEMGEFLQTNSGLASRFNRVIQFRDYTGPELAEIFRRMVAASEEHYTLSEDAEAHLEQFFEKMYLSKQRTFGNAREVRNAYQRAVASLTNRNEQNHRNGTPQSPQTERAITLADIEGVEASQGKKSVDDILDSLDDLIGMESVKQQLRAIANKVRIDRMRALRGGKSVQPNIHLLITGNPGTGKTVVAKRLGAIFKAMGVLTKGHVVERERKTLLDSYANSAGVNMDKAVDEAMGGVLFIDEAYNLIPLNTPGTKNKDGVAAVEALMTRMSNDAGKFVTVMAGYKAEMEEFVANANPGLARRFTYRIHIDDYSVDNLVDIFKLNARKEKIRLTQEAEELLRTKVEEMVTMKDKNFGNAGEMVKLFNATKERQSTRLCELPPEELTDEQLYTLEAADIPYDPPKKIDLNECMRELDELVGLSAVKKAVRELADTLTIERRRAAANDGKANVNLDHYLFLGNPGTGKTTVARIMGNIFYSLGLLPSNKVVEVTPKDLIAPYVGQTGPKTEQMINRAVGGIFFIDEAYGLDDGASGFGKDAMPVLLTKLLDYKGKMIGIAAGYPREMQRWINTNSGLESRFTRKIYFEDYTADELAEIFRRIVKQHRLQMDEYADEEMQHYFSVLVYNKGQNFANAREARNYFDRVKLNQGRRLRKRMDLPGFKEEELYVLRQEDMKINE